MSIESTLAERGSRYGDFKDHAGIAQNIKRGMMCAGMDDLPDMHRQALEVIADKIARILSGDPNYADNWHDIQGYAKLVEDRLPKPGFDWSGALAEQDALPIDHDDVDISDEAVPSKPAPDPYDWYTWKPGDLLVCEQRYSEGRGEPAINVGDFVRVLKVEDRDCVDDLPVKVNHDVLGDIWPDHEDYALSVDDKPLRRIFRFHARPTK